jgi:glycosyltransferase involved in cell wall biosynthesis
MKTLPLVSIILDNYNYAEHLPISIESVLKQSYDEFELIIVDDGSTDSSREVIEEYAKKYSRIRTVFKENGGQASAFNAGYAAAHGDIICFLDSDDSYHPDKIKEIVDKHSEGYDYIFTDHQAMDKENNPIKDNLKRYKCDGFNLFPVYYLSKYPGNITSTLSLSKKLAEQIFPLPYENDWRIQADDEIVFQASMMSRSYFLDKKLTNYRIHGNNAYFGKKLDNTRIYNFLKMRNRIKDYLLNKTGVSNTFLRNSYNLVKEFETHNRYNSEITKIYLRVLWFEMNEPILKKIETTRVLLNHAKKLKETK